MFIYNYFKFYSFFRNNLVFPVLFLLPFFASAQPKEVPYSDRVFDENIVTPLLYSQNDQTTDPVIDFGSDDRITLEFDDLSNKVYPFKYTIVHCTSDWYPSDLEQVDYIDGFFEDDLNNYVFSFNTKLPYVHYTLKFPNENMAPKLSGNYLLVVYLDEPTEGNILLTRRFYVIEKLTTVGVKIPYYPKNLSFTKKKQQLDITVTTPDNFALDPMHRFKVNIVQNGRADNMVVNMHPTSVRQYLLEFNYPEGIVFDGGNEPRFFDMKSFWYQSQYIRRIVPTSDGYDVTLHTDASRRYKEYETYGNLHGRKFITGRRDQNGALEGEYANVKFTLKQNEIKDADVYILGAISDWRFTDENKMTYNPAYRQYEATLFLKQGYYDYYYAVLKKGAQKADITFIEGDHWETKNQYTIAVYYRERMPEYDRLVGWYQFTAHDSEGR